VLVIGEDCPVPLQPLMRSILDAIDALQNPGTPTKLASVPLIAQLPPAASWGDCSILCRENNSLMNSTLQGSPPVWVWVRANGSPA
jgi:hypothetical protein